jgi:aminopeptidase N
MKFRLLICLVFCLVAAGSAAPTGPETPKRGYQLLYGDKQARWDAAGLRPVSLSAQVEGEAGFDVLHYVIDISIDPVALSVAGSVAVEFVITTPGLSAVFLHLHDGMNVSGVFEDATPLGFAHAGGIVDIDLGGPRALDDTMTVTVHYDGFPVAQGLRFHTRAVYNLSEPDMARNWFPCYDEPWDKATSEMIATVPDNRVCASNGLLVSEIDNGDGTKTYHWSTRYRLSTYLISVAISGYTSWSDWFHYTPTDSMEMPYYVYPYKEAAARIDFAPTPAMMQFFSDTFGLYPFIEEKYGTALGEVGGAMENFTCTTYGQVLVTGDNRYDWVVAHELAHTWWGNSITMADWPHIWLNEGFATYSDALWAEHTGGQPALDARLENFKGQYFDEDADSRFPIYDPVILFGATVYEKGAWILHMLRYVVGDTAFFDILRTYQATFAYSNATTEDFKAVCEAVSAMDLTSFFNEWVYQAGYPWYGYSWLTYEDGSDHYLRVRVIQVQTNAPVFTIPVELLVTTLAGDSLVRVPIMSNDQTHLLRFDALPVAVTFDPGNHILKNVNQIGVGVATPARPPALTASVVPNPGGRRVRLDFVMPESGDAVLEVYDVKGRLTGRVTRKGLAADRHSIELTGDTPGLELERSGVYFYRLSAAGYLATGKFTILR